MLRRYFAVVFSLSIACTYAASAVYAAAPPAPASSVGFLVNTMHSEFLNDLDVNDTKASGFNWYAGKWGTWAAQAPSTLRMVSGGGITLLDGGQTANYTIGSVTQSKAALPQHWVGTAYGGGGYFEAQIKFDPAMVDLPKSEGFPAWWLEPVEHFAAPHTQWLGEAPGYEHFVEVDILEYNLQKKLGPSPAAYSGATHEWYGLYKSTCPEGFCRVSNYNNLTKFNNFLINVPAGTNFNQFHRYGLLWVPATKSSQGYLQYYFDGNPTDDRISWNQFNDQKGPPGLQADWTYGIIDRLHMILVLGTGTNQPLNIRSVDVWQKSTTGNVQH